MTKTFEAYVLDLGEKAIVRKTTGRRGSETKSCFIEESPLLILSIYRKGEWSQDLENAKRLMTKKIKNEIKRLERLEIEIHA